MAELFVLKSKVIPSSARVVAFRAHEALSTPYTVDVDVLISDEMQDFQMADAVGGRASLSIDRGQGEPMVFHGVVAAIELVNQYLANGVFRVTLRPRLWQLELSEHSRVFVEQSIPEVIEDVLKDAGFGGGDYEMKLEGAYPTMEHVTQYRESSFAFVSRWMEREGIYYFFEQGDDQEKLVITDSRSSQKDALPGRVKYFPLQGKDHASGAALHAFKAKHAQLPKSVKLSDYDYIKPGLDVSGEHAVLATGPDAIVRYGDNFLTPGEGARLARVRAEELLAREAVYSAHGSQMNLHAGLTFALEDHPRLALNTKYQIVDAVHSGNQSGNAKELLDLLELDHDEVYRVDLQAIPAKTQFRAQRATAVPRIHSMQNAIVDGEASSPYAQIDAHGRYKVKIRFDEGDLKNGKASMWVRMLQPHGGSPEGFHFPLRKGTEVLLMFLGGDADRPCIAGVAPNATKPSPVLASNNTKNVIQTGGLNRFEMEDQGGAQYICMSTPPETTFIHMGAPRDGANLVENTDGDMLIKVGGDQTIRVTGDLFEHVHGDVTEHYDGDKHEVVKGDVHEHYKAELHHHTHGEAKLHFDADVEEKIKGKYELDVKGTTEAKLHAHTEIHVTAGGRDDTVKGKYGIDVDGEMEIHSTEEMTIRTDADMKVKCQKFEKECTGSIWHRWENSSEWVGGFTHEFRVGAKSEIVLGARSDIIVGVFNEMCVGAHIEVDAGAKLECLFGVLIEGHWGGSIHLTPDEVEIVGAKVEAMEVKLRAVEADLGEAVTRIDEGELQLCLLGMEVHA